MLMKMLTKWEKNGQTQQNFSKEVGSRRLYQIQVTEHSCLRYSVDD